MIEATALKWTPRYQNDYQAIISLLNGYFEGLYEGDATSSVAFSTMTLGLKAKTAERRRAMEDRQ